MSVSDPDEGRAPFRLQPALRAAQIGERAGSEGRTPADPRVGAATPSSVDRFADAAERVEQRGKDLARRIEQVRRELAAVQSSLAAAEAEARRRRRSLAGTERLLPFGVAAALAGLVGLALWARGVDYALRVTSDTPTFIALVAGMAERPFSEQSPFLDAEIATQHATPYVQALAFVWRAVGGEESAQSIGSFLALAGIGVFAFTLFCVFLYVRRLAGTTAALVSLPVLLGVFGPPHVIWASDLSLHAALYSGFFPQNVAMGTTLLALLALDRRSPPSLVAAGALASLTMLVHPFTGVLLCVLATAESARLRLAGDDAFVRAPIALAGGFAVGLLWPAYSLDAAFAETGARGLVFVGLCVAAPFVVGKLWPHVPSIPGVGAAVERAGVWLESADTAFRLAIVGAAGTAAVTAWVWALVESPPEESARLAVYWVDDRWRWPLLLVAGTVGLSGLARLARRGRVVPALWFGGCFSLGLLGAAGLPLPVWYRFLLLCQIPLAVGVAVVVAECRRPRIVGIVAATFALTLGVKVATLVWTPPTVSYFGQPLQTSWSLGEAVPPGDGLVATDPATAYFVPSTTGRKVLTVDKGHVSSRAELAASSEGYDLLRRYYAGGDGWWEAAQDMWRRGVRYVVVAKGTTLEPATLEDFIWQTARLETDAQRRALGNYYYENNRIGTLVHDSDDFAVYELDERKLFPLGDQ